MLYLKDPNEMFKVLNTMVWLDKMEWQQVRIILTFPFPLIIKLRGVEGSG